MSDRGKQCPERMELARHRAEVVMQMTRGGSTAPEIAAALGISKNTVSNIRRKTRVLLRPAGKPLTAEQESAIQALADDGVSICEIARTVGVSRPAVRSRVPWAAWDKQKGAEWGGYHYKLAMEGRAA